MEMKFNDVKPIDRDSAENLLNSKDPKKICDALIRITYYDHDYKWVQSKCIIFLNSNDLNVKRLSIICLGHLARIHKQLDKEIVIPLLKKLQNNLNVRGVVEDTLDDIELFLQ